MVSDRPGDCPICGMRLVPIEAEAGEHAAPAHTGHSGHATENAPAAPSAGPAVDGRAPIQLPERRRQLIGVRTTAVERRPLVRTIKTVGRITYDETRLHHVHTKVAGWVERLYANTTGQLVKAGEPLLTLYSPELVASAQEYLIALRGRETLTDATLPSARMSGEQLLASARRRLLLFDISPQQIRALEASGEAPTTMTLHAPISGHILTRNVTQGEKIEPGLNLLDIADLSHVWVLADVYEYELPFIRLGQRATMTLSYLPGRTFEGTVTLIYPVVAEATRTVKVRIEFPNPGFTLRPEMYAEVEIRSDLGEALVIPESAVISTGQRDLAFVDHGGGTLEPRELKIGTRLADAYEVLDGLAEGDRVVTSGNFLIDSESKLKAALAEVGSGTSGTAAGHSH
jgi:RND family efflux transporter MFP subunit